MNRTVGVTAASLVGAAVVGGVVALAVFRGGETPAPQDVRIVRETDEPTPSPSADPTPSVEPTLSPVPTRTPSIEPRPMCTRGESPSPRCTTVPPRISPDPRVSPHPTRGD